MLFDDELEKNAVPALKIIIAKWNKPVHAILICQAWKGVRTHWYGGHTIACCGTDNCPACDVGQQWVKKFYIAARSRRNDNMVILMITPTAAEQIIVHRRKGTGLLGCEIELGRSADRNTAPMTGRMVNFHPDTSDFGIERLERVVMRIFAANARLKTC